MKHKVILIWPEFLVFKIRFLSQQNVIQSDLCQQMSKRSSILCLLFGISSRSSAKIFRSTHLSFEHKHRISKISKNKLQCDGRSLAFDRQKKLEDQNELTDTFFCQSNDEFT